MTASKGIFLVGTPVGLAEQFPGVSQHATLAATLHLGFTGGEEHTGL